MNITLWILQILLALHTLIGAIWKFSHNAEQTMPSLKAIPDGPWMLMAAFEVLVALALVAPAFSKRLMRFVPMAALYIVAEMLLFSGVHRFSGAPEMGPLMYWLVVAVISLAVAYGRFVQKSALR